MSSFDIIPASANRVDRVTKKIIKINYNIYKKNQIIK